MDIDSRFLCGEEADPRLTVELWKPSPYLPNSSPCFDGMYFDERGLVFRFSDGDYLGPKTYEMQVVFSGTFESMRMNALSVYEDDRIFALAEKAGLKHEDRPGFWAFRCKYTNFFNWCLEKQFNDRILEEQGYHYILVADDTFAEVLCTEPPRVFFDGYGLDIPKGACERAPKCNFLYNYKSDRD